MSAKVAVRDASGRTIKGSRVEARNFEGLRGRLELDDGTVIALHCMIVDVVRADDVWDNDGNPYYVIKAQFGTTVLETNDEFKKGK